MSTVRLLVTEPVEVAPFAGPTRRTSMSRKTVRTTFLPGFCPKAAVLIVASMVILSPIWT